MLIPKLVLRLPPGWTQRPMEDAPLTYVPADDSTGVLQVSKMADARYAYIAGQPTLGAFAAEVGARLGWGTSLGQKDSTCAMGRLGLATFTSQDFHAMLLLIVVSSSAAYMWTWLGPDHQSEEVRQALQVICEAAEA